MKKDFKAAESIPKTAETFFSTESEDQTDRRRKNRDGTLAHKALTSVLSVLALFSLLVAAYANWAAIKNVHNVEAEAIERIIADLENVNAAIANLHLEDNELDAAAISNELLALPSQENAEPLYRIEKIIYNDDFKITYLSLTDQETGNRIAISCDDGEPIHISNEDIHVSD